LTYSEEAAIKATKETEKRAFEKAEKRYRKEARNEKLQMARKMQAAGISAAQIQEFTGLSPKDIPKRK
jgi:predicted transposase YdaD